jgi:hypothetical protein
MTINQEKSVCTGQFLDNQFVDTVIRTYKQDNWAHNSERIGKEDSLTSWTSVEEMENLIVAIKAHGGNGIRICFAAYPKDYVEDPELAGRQTIVLVATKAVDRSGTNKDLYITKGKNPRVLAYGRLPGCPPNCWAYHKAPDDPKLGMTLVDCGTRGLSII